MHSWITFSENTHLLRAQSIIQVTYTKLEAGRNSFIWFSFGNLQIRIPSESVLVFPTAQRQVQATQITICASSLR